jgi:hypothetical protein
MLTGWRNVVRAGALAAAAGAAVLAAAPARADEPLARFADPLCPGVAGLKQDAAEAVVGRIRANAEAFGLRMAAEGDCEANLLLVMVDDGRAFLDRLKDERGYLFQEITREERVALMASPGPVRVFMRTRDYSRDGHPVYRRQNMVDIPQTEMWMAHSKIYTATRRDIHSALVLVDRGEVGSLTLDQIADYATFRALSQALPRQSERGESILALFEGEAGEVRPAALTAFDRAWLGELYSGPANLPGSVRLAELDKATRDIVAE